MAHMHAGRGGRGTVSCHDVVSSTAGREPFEPPPETKDGKSFDVLWTDYLQGVEVANFESPLASKDGMSTDVLLTEMQGMDVANFEKLNPLVQIWKKATQARTQTYPQVLGLARAACPFPPPHLLRDGESPARPVAGWCSGFPAVC